MDPILIVVLIVLAVAALGAVAFVVRGRSGDELGPSQTDVLDGVAKDSAAESGTAVAERPTDIVDAPLDDLVVEEPVVEEPIVDVPVVDVPVVKPSFFDRLTKSRKAFTGFLGGLVGMGVLDDEAWEELEEALIRADIGVSTSMKLLEDVRESAKEANVEGGAEILPLLKERMRAEIVDKDRSLTIDEGETNVWLFVGVNGVGKTTTIGKLGKRLKAEGNTVLMAAGDTFRAAAAEQLTMWAERSEVEIVRGIEGSDPSSVIFDGVQAAHARGCNVVLADTAGRLQNKSNLMDELSKVRRVAAKEPGHVSEVLLVIDATTGQNGLQQAKVFAEAVDVTGVVLTKLDGSAKGGIVFAIESELDIPVKLVGLGEGVDDLIDFDPNEFVDALFD